MVNIVFSEAQEHELEEIIALLASDTLGSIREQHTKPLLSEYTSAFKVIRDNPNAKLIVVRMNSCVIGVAQINFITYLTYRGGTRAQIEGVRIHQDYRSKGVGKQLFQYLIGIARDHGCHLVQLTTDKSRHEAYKFYQTLGFVNSHEGFKLHLVSI